MSREIKFRAYTKFGIIPDVVYLGSNEFCCFEEHFEEHAKFDTDDKDEQENQMYKVNIYKSDENIQGDGVITQFTGFKDKNGLEIFDGDIIGDWTDVDGKMEQSKQTVYFDEMLGQWMLDNSLKQDKTISYSLFSELNDFEYEILGNVFENPDLLPT